MAKRTATSELNHDNWDREDQPEEAGSFSKATDDALKKRVIKVAKRRNPISSVQGEEGKSSAFGGFSGFGKSSPPAPSKAFGFLSNLANKQESPKTNGTSDEKDTDTSDKKIDEYYAKLKGLNESVTEWIKKHVTTNPFINLQPIFKDYDKYINELEKMKNDTEKSDKSDVSAKTTSAIMTPQFSLGNTTGASSVPKFPFGAITTTPSTAFSFGAATSTSFSSETSTATVASSPSSVKPIFSFGKTAGDGGSANFSFRSTVIKPADDAKVEEQEEDEPPKVEIKPVVEEDHVYSIRCKVFVKKEGSFADHGVGTLYLKPVPNSSKVQLVVRAETNLGRLICNFILSENIPIQRMGKKDVMLVCVPTPDTQPPPVPILLRVKSSEDADDLLMTLEKHKK